MDSRGRLVFPLNSNSNDEVKINEKEKKPWFGCLLDSASLKNELAKTGNKRICLPI
jgi:hypothetical protein